MKLFNALLSALVFGSAVPFISSSPAVAGCYPSIASSDYQDMLKAGTSPAKAMGVVMRDNNYDGSEDCRIKWNMEFWKDHRIKPFNNVRKIPSNKQIKNHAQSMSDTRLCWNWIKFHLPAGDVKKCI